MTLAYNLSQKSCTRSACASAVLHVDHIEVTFCSADYCERNYNRLIVCFGGIIDQFNQTRLFTVAVKQALLQFVKATLVTKKSTLAMVLLVQL